MKDLFIAAGVVSIGIFCLFDSAQAMERVNARVHFNHEDKGKFLITLTDEGKVLFTRKDLLRLGIEELPGGASTGENGYISLSPQVRAELDTKSGILHLTANPELIGTMGPKHTPVPAPVTATALHSVPIPGDIDSSKRIITNVFLKGEDKGHYQITLTETGKVLFTHEDLRRLDIKVHPGETTSGMDGYVSLSPRIHAEFADELSTLYLTVAPDPFETTTFDSAPEEELLIANVHLNLEDKGDFFIKRTEKGEMLFTHDDLLRLGLEKSPSGTSIGDGYLSLPPPCAH